MIVRFLLSLVAPSLMGAVLVARAWPLTVSNRGFSVLRTCLAIGVGLGVSSLLLFVWMLLFGRANRYYILAEAVLALAVVVIHFTKARPHPEAAFWHLKEEPVPYTTTGIVGVLFGVAMAAAVVTLTYFSIKAPYGGYDAWAIWNMHARYLFRGGDHWQYVFTVTTYDYHPDYPLLLPATVVRCWLFTGETVLVPILIGILYMFGTVGIVVSALQILRNTLQGFLAGLVLLGTPLLLQLGGYQSGDVPLAFYFIAAVALLAFYEVSGHDSGSLLLAGVAAGLSAWTKNEGLLLLVAVCAALIVAARPQNWRVWRKQILTFGAGVIPVMLAIVYFKIRLTPANDLIAGQGLHLTLHRLLDPSRYLRTVWTFVKLMIPEGFGRWFVNLLPPLLFYALVVGFKVSPERRKYVTLPTLTLVFVAMGYFMVYIVTPFPLEWHLFYSANRLCLQLWPVTVFTLFVKLNSPHIAPMHTTALHVAANAGQPVQVGEYPRTTFDSGAS